MAGEHTGVIVTAAEHVAVASVMAAVEHRVVVTAIAVEHDVAAAVDCVTAVPAPATCPVLEPELPPLCALCCNGSSSSSTQTQQ